MKYLLFIHSRIIYLKFCSRFHCQTVWMIKANKVFFSFEYILYFGHFSVFLVSIRFRLTEFEIYIFPKRKQWIVLKSTSYPTATYLCMHKYIIYKIVNIKPHGTFVYLLEVYIDEKFFWISMPTGNSLFDIRIKFVHTIRSFDVNRKIMSIWPKTTWVSSKFEINIK